jgi:hypothetical protein
MNCAIDRNEINKVQVGIYPWLRFTSTNLTTPEITFAFLNDLTIKNNIVSDCRNGIQVVQVQVNDYNLT